MSQQKKLIFASLIVLVFMVSAFSPLLTVQGQTSFNVYSIGETETTLSIEWTEVNVYASNGYILYYSSLGTNGPFNNVSISNPATTTYVLKYLNPNSNYWVYVYTSWGGFTPSSETTTTIEVTTAQLPVLQSSSVTETTVSLSWTDYNQYSNLTYFQSYTVQMMPSSGSWSTLTTLNSQSDSSYTVTGLSSGTSYSFRMYDTVYVSGVGTFSSTSNVVSVTTVSNLNVVISTSSTSISTGSSLTLSASTSGGTGPYTYQWYVNGNPVNGATSADYTFNPANAGTYSIYVVVKDSSGNSQTSNAISITVSNSIIPIGHGGANSQLFLILFVAIIIIIVIGAVLVLSKKRRKRIKV